MIRISLKLSCIIGGIGIFFIGLYFYLNTRNEDRSSQVKIAITEEVTIGLPMEKVTAYLTREHFEFSTSKNRILAIRRGTGRSRLWFSSSLSIELEFDTSKRLKRITFDEIFTGP